MGGNAFHDAVADYLADLVDKSGGIVVTDVPLFSLFSGASMVADMIVLPSGDSDPFIVEVKTGRYPTLTDSQRVMLPLAEVGGHVTALCPSLIPLGLTPGTPFPPLKTFLTGAERPGDELWGRFLDELDRR
jgi:hypothetical protein